MEMTVTEQTAPALGRILPLRRGGTRGGSAAPGIQPVPGGTEGGTVPLPVPVPPPGTVSPLTGTERGQLAIRHWAETAADGAAQLWLHPDQVGHVLWNGKP